MKAKQDFAAYIANELKLFRAGDDITDEEAAELNLSEKPELAEEAPIVKAKKP